MSAVLELELAKQQVSRNKGKSVAGVFTRNGMLYVRKKIKGKLFPYSTGKKDDDVNRPWVEYHAEEIWQEKYDAVVIETKRDVEPTLAEYGRKYYEICPDTRDTDTNDKLFKDFEQYVIPLLGECKLIDILDSQIVEWQIRMRYYPDPIPTSSIIDSVKVKKGTSRISNLRNALTLVLNQAVKDRVIPYSPADNAKIEKKKPKRKTLSIKEAENMDDDELEDVFTKQTTVYTEDEIKQLIVQCDKKIASTKSSHFRFTWKSFKCLLVFKFYTGVRSGEAIALMWKYVHFESNTIDIRFTMKNGGSLKLPKENKVRTINMLPEVRDALLALKQLSGHTQWVFLSARREPYKNVDGADKLWKQVLEAGKFKPARFYNTRHSFVTNMLSSTRNVSPEWLIQQVGHENLIITRNHYIGNIEFDVDMINNSLENSVVYQ